MISLTLRQMWRGVRVGCVPAIVVFLGAMLPAQEPEFAAGEPPATDASDAPALSGETDAAAAGEAEGGGEAVLYVKQIRVRGATILSPDEVANAVYPFLGPGRSLADLEEARLALEEAHKAKGYQTVGVEIPEQNGSRGVIFMDVVENKVGRLRVRGARFFLPSEVKKAAPSLREGSVPRFDEVTRDVVKLNGWADRRVTPELKPGVAPGTVDVDLKVEDSLPLHGSIELNNRHSPDTTPLRLNASLSYDNLWQRGHGLGFAAQLAPERIEDAEIYSAYYLARFSRAPDFSLLLNATRQNSDISTLGGAAVAGRGEIVGARGLFALPARGIYHHSLSVGLDYKSFEEVVVIGEESFSTPIDYYPASVAYGGGWTGKSFFTELNASATFHLRGMGSLPGTFDAKRYLADGSFVHFRGDVSHTQDLPGGFQAFVKGQGQATKDPLINSEQFAGGGASTVRGYLESEALGDGGWFVTAELRTPSFLPSVKKTAAGEPENEWRFHFFFDGGRLYLNDPLPEQIDAFELASYGVGSRITLLERFQGGVDVAWPLVDQGGTRAREPFVSFRFLTDF